ncbi:hypothetical protein [Leifsonia aquatica]|uniref:hypothetical protein n=1 Tax=Leifsonia aquatica TaxID=144185 RepID=UPI0028AAF93E|nr:hypothetical protein [Leifsonia aquatica]
MQENQPLSLIDAIALERRGALAASREALVERWNIAPHDKETALRLAFIEWWSCSEPDFLTGLPAYDDSTSLFPELFAYLSSPSVIDARVRFVLGWMTKEFPWCCGCGPARWEPVGNALWAEYKRSDSLDPSQFSDGSEFGRYFSHILKSHQTP